MSTPAGAAQAGVHDAVRQPLGVPSCTPEVKLSKWVPARPLQLTRSSTAKLIIFEIVTVRHCMSFVV